MIETKSGQYMPPPRNQQPSTTSNHDDAVFSLASARLGRAFVAPSGVSRTTIQGKSLMMGAYMMPEEPEEPKEPAKQPRPPPTLPTVEGGSGQLDVISRLLKDRILLLGTDVNDEVANVLVAQLLYLANEDPEKDITLYINSPGGSVSAGLAIYDTMQFIPCDVQTVCFGMAASMGAFLLGAGAPGKRKSLPNARIMIHQPLGGAQGQAADIEIQAKEILFVKACLNKYIAEYCDQPVEKIEEDTDRDFFMTPYEAQDYGIIDEVIKTKTSHIPLPAMPSLRD
eukprot:scaffold55_cov181-Alexandrium_tamarense.AAC.20